MKRSRICAAIQAAGDEPDVLDALEEALAEVTRAIDAARETIEFAFDKQAASAS